jgi:hypothetical protein
MGLFCAGTLVVLAADAGDLRSSTPRFYDDDPLLQDVDSRDASGVQERTINLIHDYARNLFATPGSREDRRALNINTIDEVPDSSWFVNRLLRHDGVPLTGADVAQGPGDGRGPAPGAWTVVSSKREGATPGFVVLDADGERWFIKFDPADRLEMTTGAEIVGTKLFHAIGYHVPQNAIAFIRREDLVVTGESTTIGMSGASRPMRASDVDALLRGIASRADGSYRVLASRALPGRPVGGFRFHGTRLDDPNDVVPHEHRRELRALRVFAAWVNHWDSKALNTLDTIVRDGDREVVRHHLIDFGSTLGSAATRPTDFDAGHMYAVEPRSLLVDAFTFGFRIRPFERIRYPDLPAAGRFSADHFDPDLWKPLVPNPAFLRARADDLFWGARRVMAFTDDMIAAAVASAQYSDERVSRHITETLIARRDLIGRAWLTRVNPLIHPTFDGSVLSFRNAAVDAGVAAPPAGYRAAWFAFDNATDDSTNLAETRSVGERMPGPDAVSRMTTPWLRVDVAAVAGPEDSWTTPVRLYFRRTAERTGWRLVGLERLPEGPTGAGAGAPAPRPLIASR